MLDKKTTAVMTYVNQLTEDGGYKVIDADDVAQALPEEKVDRDALRQIVQFLQQREFISVKYAADDEYCLTSLPKGRSFVEKREEMEREGKKQEKTALSPFWVAFAGGFSGAFFGAIFFLLLRLLS